MKIKMHLLGTGIAVLLSVYAVTAYAGQGIRQHRRSAELIMPEIRYDAIIRPALRSGSSTNSRARLQGMNLRQQTIRDRRGCWN